MRRSGLTAKEIVSSAPMYETLFRSLNAGNGLLHSWQRHPFFIQRHTITIHYSLRLSNSFFWIRVIFPFQPTLRLPRGWFQWQGHGVRVTASFGDRLWLHVYSYHRIKPHLTEDVNSFPDRAIHRPSHPNTGGVQIPSSTHRAGSLGRLASSQWHRG